jgi:hypothetical protein
MGTEPGTEITSVPSTLLCLLLAAFLCATPSEAAQSGQPLSILDVPFISQSEALCGGAAAAMVMRYWGARGLDAESFAHLVDRSASGIRTGALVGDLRMRGWTALALEGSGDTLSRELAAGRPLLTLIEDRPGTFHYVVLIGLTSRAVVYHDPARSPFRTMSRDEFDRRWTAASRWTAVVLPPASGAESPPPSASSLPSTASCEGLIDGGVRSAQANDLEGAERQLTSALSCGGSAALRELAGVRLLQRRWQEVSDLATAAVTEDPDDDHAWRLLATSRFIQDDRDGALDAWNRVNEPRVDLIRVDGLERTRQRVVEDLIRVERGVILTPGRLTHARRHLRELPAASSADLSFVPAPSGVVELRAAVAERSLFPDDRWTLTALGAVAAIKREVEVSTGALTGGGERITLAWRFWPGRPRVAGAIAAPAPWGGIWGVDAFTERQRFTAVLQPSERRGGHVVISDWAAHWARTAFRAGVEQWKGVDTFGTAGAGLRFVTPGDRIDSRVDLVGWKGARSFGTVDIGSIFRSTAARRGVVLIGRAGMAAASSYTPADLWFAGDTGRARGIPLRAHPVVTDGELRVEQIGRSIWYTSGEAQRWWSWPRVRVGGAMFVDTARTDRRVPAGARTDVDLGMGARFAVPAVSGLLRIDVAKGLRDGATAVSLVYEP